MSDERSLPVREPDAILPPRPVANLATMQAIRKEWVEYLQDMLKPGVDFYKFEGYAKEALSKAGGENLIKCAGYAIGGMRFVERTERWDDPPFFAYILEVDIVDRRNGQVVGMGVGEANSHESKYRWRWVPKEQVPKSLDAASLETRDATLREFAFAVDKSDTAGRYGKPAAHWQAFREAIASGKAKKVKARTKKGQEMDAWEIGGTLYRIPNLDVASVRNTLIKMCKKRAVVDGALTATGMSDRFTQYEEDEDAGAEGTDVPEAPIGREASGATIPAADTTSPPVTDAGGDPEDDPRLWVARLLEQMERTGRTEAQVRLYLKKAGRALAWGPGDYDKMPLQDLVLVCQWLSGGPDKGA